MGTTVEIVVPAEAEFCLAILIATFSSSIARIGF